MTTMPDNHREPWEPHQDEFLQHYWGKRPIDWIAATMKRTLWAVYRRAAHLKLGAFHKDRMTLTKFSQLSGFGIVQICTAASRLGVRLFKYGSSLPSVESPNTYALSPELQASLMEFLMDQTKDSSFVHANRPGAQRTTRGMWGVGRKPASCLHCERSDKPHFATGLCQSCYNKPYKGTRRRALPDFTTDNARFEKILADMAPLPDFSRDNARFEQILSEISAPKS
jgi:hypothetical protein